MAPVSLLVMGLAWTRMLRIRRLFMALYARYRAGTLPTPHTRKPRTSPRPAAAPAAPDAPKLPLLTRGWAIECLREKWHVAAWCSPIERWLANPEMAAFVLAAPQAGRLLRPLCRMMAIDIPTFLQLPKRPRAPRKRPPIVERPAAAERPAGPIDIDSLTDREFAELLHKPRDNNCPPTDVGYGRSRRWPKPDWA